MSYSNTLAHQLPPSANGYHRNVQKTNSLNEEEMEKYLSLSVPVLPAPPAAVAVAAMKTIPARAVNKNNEHNTINDNNEEELHSATTPSPVPHIAAVEWGHHSHNSTHHTQSHSLERERNSLHKHHNKMRSESKTKTTQGDKNKSYQHHHGYDREEQQHTDNDKRRSNLKKKLQGAQYSSQPIRLTNHRYASEEQETLNLLNKYNKNSDDRRKQLSSKEASNRENYTSHHHQHHHSLHEQKLEEEEEVKHHSKTAHSLPLRERSNKSNMNETMWNLRRLEAILQPTYNSTLHTTSSLPLTSSSPPYASTRVERSKQHKEQYNNINKSQAQTSRIDFTKEKESFLNGNSNNNTRASVYSTSLHPIRTTPPLPSKAIITPTTTNTINNNNNKNNMLVVAANAEEHAYLLSEYVNKLEKEVNAISLEHAESCKLLVCFAEEREQFSVITNEQETRSSIVEDESRALFDLYVLFTTVTLHRMETRWMQQMNGMHVEVQALREANTTLENNRVKDEKEHNKCEGEDEVARKQQIFANNEPKELQHMPKEQIDTDSRYTLAEALAAAAVITIESIKSSVLDKTEKETTLQTVHEYENITNNETKNVELRFTTFVKDLCKELHISSFDSTSHNVLAPSEELLESIVLKLKELRKQESEPNADKQKKMLHGYELQETSKIMTEYFASFMTHFTIVNELYNEYCESKCEFANESAQLFLCVERIKLQHWHNDTEQFNEEKHIALLETLKSLRLQVEQYKGALQSIEEEQRMTQQHQTEINENSNAKSSISNSNSISLSAYSTRCVSELPYIPSRMKLHVEPANRSFHATEMDQIRKEAIRLGVRESTNVVTNTISMPKIRKENVCDSKRDNQVTTVATCQKETNDMTMKDTQEKPFKDIVSNQLKEETKINKVVESDQKIDNNNTNNNTTSTKNDTSSISNVNKESAQEGKIRSSQETRKNSGSTDNKVNTNNAATTITTPALTVPAIKRFVAKTVHSTSSYSSYSQYSRSSSSVASDASSHTSTEKSTKEESKRTEINKINTNKDQESEKAATTGANVNTAVPTTQEEKEVEGNKATSDEKLKGQDARPQESHLEDNTKVLVDASLEEKNNDKKQIKVSEKHYKEERKGNADASSYYSSSSESSSYSRSISVTSSSSSSSGASNTNKDDEKNSKRGANHKTGRKALTDSANESTLNKVNKSSDEGNSTNVQKCITNSEAEKMSKENDKKRSDTKQEKKEDADNIVEHKDNKRNYKKGKPDIEYDDSLTLDVSLTMDDSESDADTKSNTGSTTEKQHIAPEIVINKTNAPSISGNRVQSENSSKITTQNVKVNSDIVADSVEKNKLKRRSSFDDDIDEQDVIDKANANSNVSKIVANIARQNQFTNMYANNKTSKFK